jgi:FixJ family two-component response regulator
MNLHEVSSPQAVAPQATPVVFVVDDDISVRDSLELLIENAGWHPIVYASSRDFLAHPRIAAPTCLILDVTLPEINGLDLQVLLANRPELPIIFITAYGNVSMTVRAMKAGAVEFLTKPFREETLLEAIREAVERSQNIMRKESVIRTLRVRYASLSSREREVMNLVITGLLNKQVGARLGISEITVKAHRGRMMHKMHAHSIGDLINMAVKLQAASAPKS